MKNKIRAAAILGALTIAIAACSGGGATQSPAARRAAPSRPGAAAGGESPAAALSGEPDGLAFLRLRRRHRGAALKTVTDLIKAANPDLDLTIQDVKFDDLFKKFELEARQRRARPLHRPERQPRQGGPRGLFLDITSQLEGKLERAGGRDRGQQGRRQVLHGPGVLKAVAMYYDKSKIATPPATTDELLQAVKDGKIKAGFDAHSSYHSFGWWAAFGGELMDDAGKCIADTTGVPDAYQYFQELQDAGATWYDKYDDLASDFKSGQDRPHRRRPVGVGRLQGGPRRQPRRCSDAGRPEGPSQPLTGWYINTNARTRPRGRLRSR